MNDIRRWLIYISVLVAAVFGSGCGLIEAYFTGRSTVIEVDSLPPTYTPTPFTMVTPCAFSWATQPRPDLVDATTAILDGILDQNFETVVTLYGETCGTRFLAMTTDFDMMIVDAPECSEAAMTLTMESIAARLSIAVAAGEFAYPARLGWLAVSCRNGDSVVRVREMIDRIVLE